MQALTHERPPPRELFFASLQVDLDPRELESVQFAYRVSKYGHAKQLRDDGRRYFDHPKAAAWIYISELQGRDPRTIINALLHDLSEDTFLLSGYRLKLNFGPEIALDIRALTKLRHSEESTREYLARIIARGPHAIVAKLCDRLHNLRDLSSRGADKRGRQFEETRAYHLQLLIPPLQRCSEPWATHAKVLGEKVEQAIASYG